MKKGQATSWQWTTQPSISPKNSFFRFSILPTQVISSNTLITDMLDFERKVVSINNKEVKFVVRVRQFVIFYIKKMTALHYTTDDTLQTNTAHYAKWKPDTMANLLYASGGGSSSLRACNSYSKPKSQHFYRQLVYFRPLFSKFRSICEKAMAETWVSCTLLVMGSWYLKVFLC